MSKERIKLSDISEGYNHEEYIDNLYEQISDKQVSFDSEKGFVDIEVIIRRKVDNKFFKYTYTDYGRGDDDILEQVAEEVEQKERVEYYYE